MWKSLDFEPGLEFGISKIIKKLPNKDGRSNFLCQCACGNIFEALGKSINRTLKYDYSGIKSCGCLTALVQSFHTCSDEKDLVGQKFGNLTVIIRDFSKLSIDKHTSYYLCQCDCGNEKVVSRKVLKEKNGNKSCGCLLKLCKKNFAVKFIVPRLEELTEKKCKTCKKTLQIEMFYKKGKTKFGMIQYKAHCKNCLHKDRE